MDVDEIMAIIDNDGYPDWDLPDNTESLREDVVYDIGGEG